MLHGCKFTQSPDILIMFLARWFTNYVTIIFLCRFISVLQASRNNMSESGGQETHSNGVCRYVHDRNVKTSFLETPNTEDQKPTKQWMSQLLDYLDPEMFERLLNCGKISKNCTIIDLIRKDLEPFQPGEKTGVEHLMDYVVAFKDQEVKPTCIQHRDNLCEVGKGQIDPGEVGASDCGTCLVCAGDVGTNKNVKRVNWLEQISMCKDLENRVGMMQITSVHDGVIKKSEDTDNTPIRSVISAIAEPLNTVYQAFGQRPVVHKR